MAPQSSLPAFLPAVTGPELTEIRTSLSLSPSGN